MDTDKPLQFAPFSSFVNPAFWTAFSGKKLDDLGLDERPISLVGYYTINDAPGLPASLSVGWDAFLAKPNLPPFSFACQGRVINKNTLESFKGCDKKALMEEEKTELLRLIRSGEAIKSPEKMNRFFILMHADLKKYLFYYWFAFPALAFPGTIKLLEGRELKEAFSGKKLENLSKAVAEWNRQERPGFFVIFEEGDSDFVLCSLEEGVKQSGKGIICYSDPWTKSENPGWPLRNLLATLQEVIPESLSDIRLIGIKCDKSGNVGRSVLFRISVTPAEGTGLLIAYEC